MPPMHPWCRSTTIAVIDGAVTKDLKRRARDPETGELYEVPSDMTYEEWKKSIVDGDVATLKMANNSGRSNDWSKTIPQQVSQEEKNRLIEYGKSKGVEVVDLSKFDGDPKLLEKQIDQLSKLQNEYPTTTKTFLKVGVLDDGDFAMKNGDTIVLNTKALRDESITVSNIIKDNYFSSETFTSIVTHEYAHILEKQYGKKGIDITKKVLYNIGEKIDTDDGVLNYLQKNISKYSSEYDEGIFFVNNKLVYNDVIAEVFAKHNDTPTEFTKEFIKIFMKR